MTLSTSFERIGLDLERPFRIARGSTETVENVVVEVTDADGTTGIGAAAPSRHYGETADTVEAVLPDLLAVVEAVDDPLNFQRVERRARQTVRRNPAARAAVDVALHDLAAKRADLPLYRYLGLDPAATVETTYTVGIDDPGTMAEKARGARDRGFDRLKVKVGTGDDDARLRAVREAHPDATIRVDANEAWAPREAVERVETLSEYGLEFVEQPVPAEHPTGLGFVRERSPLPIVADESSLALSDVPRLAGRADAVNLKLMKCGGIRETVRTIHAARAHGLEVMLGCMVESNASIAAAAHLAPLLDYADLDGSLLLAADPYDGVPMPGGRIALDALERTGTGAARSA